MSLESRFRSKFTRGADDECWVWTGATNENGYGLIHGDGRGSGCLRAHRVSWEMHRGPIPAGLQVLHECDNPPCVNPRHLRLGTRLENMADMVRRGRASRGADRPQAKLTDSIVAEARRRRANGERLKDLAAEYGVQPPGLSMAINGRRWKHVA